MGQFTQVLVSGLSQGSIYALLGLGFCIVSMSTRILNIAQGAYALVGGFLFVTLAVKLKLPMAAAFALCIVRFSRSCAPSSRNPNPPSAWRSWWGTWSSWTRFLEARIDRRTKCPSA